ncbi:Flavonol synthase/flavanone 3-hydroxylase [Purpureocillium lavendulum]|uniref:Flavonol synthase/flavanone 3-hydroxylase n=1 Tax=Purpureocillium lavendulum TaxID=1247861 RepID=A0AB34FDU0_9HYPO|nr:Flavonol synthase/flavanone 3-hydroxylase [Purpureocillium lavendulum]
MADEYSTKGLPPAPAVSMRTIPMAGLLVDVYGLDELPPAETGAPLTCLWLLHPRTRTRARMADIARRTIYAWNESPLRQQQQQQQCQHGQGSSSFSSSTTTTAAATTASSGHGHDHGKRPRGLIALAFDMPNHGSREVSAAANQSWAGGNAQHALDMAGMVRGAAADAGFLMEVVGAYVGREGCVDAHVALGWSLGGHAAWQAVVGEDRVDAAVVVIGCPDLLGLLTDRASKANLDTGGRPLLGSKYLPPSLIRSLAHHDPRAILFGGAPGASGEAPVPTPPLDPTERERLRPLLDRHLRGKKVLLCSGGADELVPHARTRPVAAVLEDAARGWYADGGLEVRDAVYEGVGHHFSAGMVGDAVEFLVRAVAAGPRARGGVRASS